MPLPRLSIVNGSHRTLDNDLLMHAQLHCSCCQELDARVSVYRPVGRSCRAILRNKASESGARMALAFFLALNLLHHPREATSRHDFDGVSCQQSNLRLAIEQPRYPPI